MKNWRYFTLLSLFCFCLSGYTLLAQYSAEAFEQKAAGELFDERGFLQSEAISVDGKLAISNSNGNVSYSYPISSWKNNGYSFSASLNYCGSVAFTTHGEYIPDHDENPFASWNRFTQNRPVWLVGVNGFAVQALSLATAFHADPAWVTGRYENTSQTDFDDEDFVWAIDGYDLCNRMQDFAVGDHDMNGAGSKPYTYRDVIRLLRADGSVLELKNVNHQEGNDGASSLWSVSEHLYSGYYVVNEANASGYARVEYQDQNDLQQYLADYLPNTPRYTPRIVHYYPGDGLEYIFKETFNPFGMQDFNDVLVQFGGAKANPTIFYLTEIRDARLQLVDFEYSRHANDVWEWTGTGLNQVEIADSTVGRALLTRVGDHHFTYGSTWLKVTALGRTTTVRFDSLAISGNAETSEAFPLSDLGYYTPYSAGLANVPQTNDGLYKSWVGYVTKIIDPEGRETTFDYETYERRHVGFHFPRTGSSIKVALKNYRLNEVVEPTAKYELKYHNRSKGIETLDVDGLDTLSVFQGSVGDYPFAFSNSARLMEKRTLGGTLLTNSTYDFFFENALISTTPTGAEITTEDNISGHKTSTVYKYQSDTLPRALWHTLEPPKRHTHLKEVTTYGITNGVKTDSTYTITHEAAVVDGSKVAPYLWLPTSQSSRINNVFQSEVVYHYQLDTVRHYGDHDSLIKYHGLGVSLKETQQRDALLGVHVIDSMRYLNIPEYDTLLLSTTDTIFDKFAMHRKFDSLRGINDPIILGMSYIEAMYDPRILTVKTINTPPVTIIPPMFDLPVETWRSDVSGTYLSGSKNTYCLLGDCDAGAGTLDWGQQLVIRGVLLTDTLYGRNRLALPGMRVLYPSLERGMPDSRENVFGAISRSYYFPRHPGIPSGQDPSGNILANDDGVYNETLQSGTFFALTYELPLSERAEVRRYDPGLTLQTDTLTTMFERTFFGQVSGTVDPNGWLTRYDYDYNGRLNTAWLPYDFQSHDSVYTFDYTGLESLIGYAATGWTVYYDTIDCNPNDPLAGSSSDPLGGSPNFFIDKPLKLRPKCGGGHDTVEVTEQKGASTQALGTSNIPWTHRSPAKATLSFAMPSAQGHDILSLDSAFVDLYVATIIGECVTVKVTMPEFETFEKIFVLNCESATSGPPGGGGQQSGTTGGGDNKGISIQSGNPDTLAGVIHLQINLNAYLDSIETEDHVRFFFETTTTGAEVHFVNGYESDDGAAPRLQLYGDFRKKNPLADYTLHYEYDDENLTSEIFAKVDDSAHSANIGVGGVAMLGESRRTSTTHFFGADYRLLKSKTPIGSLDNPHRHDSVLASYDGLGNTLTATDQVGDAVTTRYDAFSRGDTTWNQDNTFSTIDYYYCNYDPNWVDNTEVPCPPDCQPPTDCFGITDQDFYGFIKAQVTTNENGVKFVTYYDSFDRLRREVADSGGVDERITKYEYDIVGRLKEVINPAGDTTTYWYDDFGRVQYKQQPDLGTISYAYDKLGNVRFAQTQEQSDNSRITFNEYDDLNRLVIVGEADFHDPPHGGGGGGGGHQTSIEQDDKTGKSKDRITFAKSHVQGVEALLSDIEPTQTRDAVTGDVVADPEKGAERPTLAAIPTDPTLNLNRLTDQIDPDILHDDSLSAILTANKTLWMALNTYGKALPTFWGMLDTISRDCVDMNTALPDATGPFLKHVANTYDPTTEISTFADFENLAKHPENVRIAISYDQLPYSAGAAWESFPTKTTWDGLSPTGTVRNLKGREAAVAYREHGGEPFHYSVMSYDERGRPEALIRYTENLGFDAVYYQYNSMNDVIAVTVADPLRQFTTWYGYDDNGRVDSVWTLLGDVGTGLDHLNPVYPLTPLTRPTDAQITYVYTPTGQIDSMLYPKIDVVTTYNYSPRKWLDTLLATKAGVDLFRQELTFDPTGQITAQTSTHGANPQRSEAYNYDNIGQLTSWAHTPPGGTQSTETYAYDLVGNRTSLVTATAGATPPLPQTVYSIGRTTNPSAGPNQLLKTQVSFGGVPTPYTDYTYDTDGAMNSRQNYDANSVLQQDEQFEYSSWRGLSWKYEREDLTMPQGMPNQWEYRYRYNATGEREQKREWLNPAGDATAPGYEWTYYLLGAQKQQMSIWQGMQTSQLGFCGSTGGSQTYLYPTEYLTYGGATANLITRPNSAIEYRIADNLGSNRLVLDNTGASLSTTDYQPFGNTLSGTATRKSWIETENDTESGLSSLGVRAYDNSAGRFTSIDPAWEKTAMFSPYQYSGNNPVILSDPSGFFVDLFRMFNRRNTETNEFESIPNPRYGRQLIKDLKEITGLDLKYNDETGRLEIASDRVNGGSKTARDVLTALIKDENDGVTVNPNVKMNTAVGGLIGANTIHMNPRQISDLQRDMVGVNGKSTGWGMIFFHEYGHTEYAGSWKDPKQGEAGIGYPDALGNIIRLELGEDWGQRVNYNPIKIGETYYLPFTQNALECLNSGIVPESGYTSYTDSQKKWWVDP